MSNIAEENIIKILSRLDVPGNAAKIYIYLLKIRLYEPQNFVFYNFSDFASKN